jgi:hypothetical protein
MVCKILAVLVVSVALLFAIAVFLALWWKFIDWYTHTLR